MHVSHRVLNHSLIQKDDRWENYSTQLTLDAAYLLLLGSFVEGSATWPPAAWRRGPTDDFVALSGRWSVSSKVWNKTQNRDNSF